ncbi:hypothetical protein [cf. Phormidesmis sp. LEGE 11477]|uniref:hypothetical protein n=1 Tax=cf. Phormidesmis sp. LEGE 11477 TaxID=1828680 RepID=UPI00187E0765|nr:hypothetical protein [cf. Phormidesmis sp. LEGE 11477]MBE9064064.1 hypothetical protein [cf. Phormidesmis sp. LEGE 11477]
MSPALSIAASLSPDVRQDIGIQLLSRSKPISDIAATHQVSRKFVYQQGDKARQALDESFAPSKGDDDVLFHLPVTKNWLYQLILGLVLICHSSYRGVVELFRDLFDTPISIGTIHNRLDAAAATAAEINQSQDLSGIEVGLHDEIYQSNRPVLVGIDAASTYCYLLQSVERRDEETWGWYLLDNMAQGFAPKYTIADGGSGLRAGQKAVMPKVPCHGDVFHIQQQFEQVANGLARQAQGATTRRVKLEQKITQAKLTNNMTQKLTIQQVKANRRERGLVARARDVKILLHWFEHDVMALAGPELAERQELFDFIEAELQQRAGKQYSTIRKLRKALHNQRDQLLAFAGVLDQKLAALAADFELPLQVVRDICLWHRKHNTSNAYWERWTQLHRQLSDKFYGVMKAVEEALKQTPRASSLVENLNSRLRNYFFLRRSLGDSYLSLLQFFCNHRCFSRSRVPERVGKSPKQLLTGETHPHWLELLGFERFQRA